MKKSLQIDILKPVSNVQIVKRSLLKPNDYNPNKVLEENLKLLTQSILTNGWTLPIVCRPDMTIIDGFHRWTVAGREPLRSKLKGMVPIVIVEHQNEERNIYGTITHNRARGTHLLEPMEKIVQSLLKKGIPVPEIAKQIGMKPEEVFRLSGLDRQKFLELMLNGTKTYSRASKGVRI
jgi:ParB-like chromosome segregation protein Spo0J